MRVDVEIRPETKFRSMGIAAGLSLTAFSRRPFF